MEGMETNPGATSAPSAGAAPPPGATAAPPPGATGGPAAAPTATGAATTASSTSAPSTTSSDMLKLSQAMTAAGSATPPPSGAPITATNTAPAPGTPAAAGGNQAFPKKNKESMTQLSPASYGGSSGDATLSSMFRGMASGAANQRTQAYNTLNSLGGGAGANANTDELLGQQTEMINNLKAIEPVLKTAEKFLDKFENSSISKMFQNMGGNIPGLSLLTGSGGGGASNGIGM